MTAEATTWRFRLRIGGWWLFRHLRWGKLRRQWTLSQIEQGG